MLSRLNIAACVKPEDKYDLAFKLQPQKFTKLPSANFGLDFYPPYSKWFFCGDYFHFLKQESQKPAKQVVSTKHTLDSFKGFLHYDLSAISIISPTGEGVEPKDLSGPFNYLCYFFYTWY